MGVTAYLTAFKVANKAWRDKAGIPHVNVPYSSGDNWAYDQYNGLSKQDKRLVKALMGAAKSLKLTSAPLHNIQ